jgi:hypothetical protein
MATVHEQATRPARPRQFSLRALFELTLVVSVVLAIGVLTTPWASITAAVVLAVWLTGRRQLVAPRWLGIASIGLFGISLCLPAINIPISTILATSDYVVWGGRAFLTTFVTLPEVLWELWMWNEPDEIDWAFAYLIGAAANAAFLSAFAASLFPARFIKTRTFARRAAILAVGLVAVDFALILNTGEPQDIYPGFGFWAASMLALALATRRA